jgi:Asp-tRNA(Asn)/Glu-tRNA(Gln) amidotransferase A subunit family amidase
VRGLLQKVDVLSKSRLGLPKQFKIEWEYDVGSAECIRVVYDQAEKVLKSLGAEVVQVDIPEWEKLCDREWTKRKPFLCPDQRTAQVKAGVMAEDFKAELPIYLQGLQT